jgi:uncharacterized membrane protein YcaP (DUF421 family)
MEKEEIHIYDIQRILQGNVPMEFYIELFIRAIVVYLVITFAMRLMGKRLSAGLSRGELAALATLAAGMGAILTAPERGLLPAILIVIVLVLLQRFINRRDVENRKLERLIQGERSILVADGVLQLEQMKKTRISKERLIEQLRNEQVEHLGMVKRLYLEANGSFSLLKNEKPSPGLSILPDFDKEFLEEQLKSEEVVCHLCGNKKLPGKNDCIVCGHSDWVAAVE